VDEFIGVPSVQIGSKPDQISDKLKQWVDYAKSHKAIFVNKTERGDITPTVIVERDGEVQAIVSASEVDKHQGIAIAALSQIGFDPDYLTMIMDAHVYIGKPTKGQTPEQAADEFRKKFPNGLQAACDNDGACDLGEIADCLICHRIDRNGNIEMVTLPYSYHGKNGPPFSWMNEEKFKESFWAANSDDDENKLSGFIPESLRDIMSKKKTPDHMPDLEKLAESMNLPLERARFHAARAVMLVLAEKGYFVKDYVTPLHLDWIDYMPKAISFIEFSIKKGVFPREAKQPLLDLIEAHLGKSSFQKSFVELLKNHSYWIPKELRGEENQFALLFESLVMSPSAPSKQTGSLPEDFNPLPGDKIPERVRVWNGDQTQYLGEGKYVGEADVYFIRRPDGSILSNHNAEIEPDPSEVPDDCVVVSSTGNPKIVLDNGDTVYGCQVWWEPVEDAPVSKHQGHLFQNFGGWNSTK